MKKILLILAVISFALPIFFYHWATVTYRDDSINYFVEMYDIMHHHLFIEGGLGLLPFLSFILGGILLFIRSKFFSQFPKYWYCGLDDTPYTEADDKETP